MLFFSAVGFATISPALVYAEGNNGCGIDTALISCADDPVNNSGSIEDNGIWKLLLMALRIMTAGVGVLAVGGIVYGAILYTSAGDRSEQVKKAISVITNVVIGLIAYIGMYAVLEFLIPGGIFS